MLLKKGKKKNKHSLPDGEINITSLMDILTTLLFFILMVMSLQKFAVLESTSLTVDEETLDDKKQVFTLQVTMQKKNQAIIWLGPFNQLHQKMNQPDRFEGFVKKRFVGNHTDGFTKIIKGQELTDTLQLIQKTLTFIKLHFPQELNAVASFADEINYQEMMDTLSAVRELGPQDEGIVYRTVSGEKEKTKVLFPQVIIAEEGV